MNQTIQSAVKNGDIATLEGLANNVTYIAMDDDSTNATYNGIGKWGELNNDASAIDEAINNATPGDPSSLGQVLAASQQMGQDCKATGASSP